MSEVPRPRYVVDPDFPRAPSQRVWNAMSPEERLRVQHELPAHLPEGADPFEGRDVGGVRRVRG